MKKMLLLLAATIATTLAAAQEARPFSGEIRNEEHKIYIRMNLYDKDMTIPGQDVLGQVNGYIGSTQSASKWMIIDSRIIDDNTAEIDVVNDYGSEDFTATLKLNADGTYTYDKRGGSTLKFAVKGKWQKIPGKVDFEKVRK